MCPEIMTLKLNIHCHPIEALEKYQAHKRLIIIRYLRS